MNIHSKMLLNSSSCYKWLCTLAFVTLCAVVAMFYMAFTAEHARLEYSFSQPLVKVALQGQFRVDDGNWQPYPPENIAVLSRIREEIVEFSGHVQADIPQGQNVFVYVRHVRATLSINGTEVFTVGAKGSTPAFTRTPGSLWASFVSPGISPDDTVTIQIQRVAGGSHPYQLEPFLEKIHYGSVWELLKMELSKVWWAIPLVPLFMTMSILLMILIILFAWRKETKFALQATFLAGVYISVGLWTLLGYEVVSLIVPFPAVVIAWETFSLLFSAAFIVLYVSTLLTEFRRILAIYTVSLLFFVLIGSVVLQLAGYFELFVIQSFLQLIALGSVIACICFAYMERKVANSESIQAFMTFIPLCALGAVDIVINTFGSITNGVFASTGFLITSALQVYLLVNAAYKQMEQASRLERELVESRVAVTLSQIRPHFLYNVLTGIQYLCAEAPSRAERAVTDFTMFLRGNLDSLSSSAPIPLAQEMEHVRRYLALEQLRYGDKLRVEWDLEQMDFQVPSLSVQPLVENAVHWGMREDGLTVRIATRTTNNGHAIIVQDDGMGFDPHTERLPQGNGVGLASIRTRVRDIYGGSLHIDSAPGKGTVVTLLFPANIH